jgi:hypothetical protein
MESSKKQETIIDKELEILEENVENKLKNGK